MCYQWGIIRHENLELGTLQIVSSTRRSMSLLTSTSTEVRLVKIETFECLVKMKSSSSCVRGAANMDRNTTGVSWRCLGCCVHKTRRRVRSFQKVFHPQPAGHSPPQFFFSFMFIYNSTLLLSVVSSSFSTAYIYLLHSMISHEKGREKNYIISKNVLIVHTAVDNVSQVDEKKLFFYLNSFFIHFLPFHILSQKKRKKIIVK